MEAHRRRQAILSLLESTGEVGIEDLAGRFAVSPNSIRNDLDLLAREGRLSRVRGGAVVSANGPTLPTLAARAASHPREKQHIGQWAAGLVKNGDTLILDASSSAFQLATGLRDRRNLTVLTNGLDVALMLAQNPSNRVILAANTVSPGGSSLTGSLPTDLAQGFYATLCFVSCAGLTVEQGLTDADGDIAQLKAQMIRLARQVVAVVDHSKVGKVSTFGFATLGQIDHLVTDEAIRHEALVTLRRAASFPITVVGATSSETLSPRVGPSRNYRIGFGNLTERMVFAQQVRRSLERAAKELVNIELLIRDNDMDRTKTLENAEWFVANGVDLVVEYQIDAGAGNVIMDKLNRAGIPVIAVDIPLPGATFFGADNYRAGFMAGEALGTWVKAHWNGRLDVLLKLEAFRVGPAGSARLQGLHEGIESVIGLLSQAKIIEIDGPVLVADATPIIANLLPSIARDAQVGIIGINDEVVIGALSAFEQQGRLHQVVGVGQNADRMARETLRRPDFPLIGSTRYAPENYGPQLLALATKIIQGEAVPPAVYIEHVFITHDNIERYYPLAVDQLKVP